MKLLNRTMCLIGIVGFVAWNHAPKQGWLELLMQVVMLVLAFGHARAGTEGGEK